MHRKLDLLVTSCRRKLNQIDGIQGTTWNWATGVVRGRNSQEINVTTL